MIYIIHGDEPYLINKKIAEIISGQDADVIRLETNKDDTKYLEIVESCRSFSLFSAGSVVVVRDPDFLISKNDKKDLSVLLDYCTHPVYESKLIFYTLDNSFNTRLNAFKQISKNAEVISYPKFKRDDFYRYCYNRINECGLKLSKETAASLIEECSLSVTLFESNLELLCLYPDKIDRQVVDGLTSGMNEEKVFDFIDALTQGKLSLAYSKAQPLLDSGSIYGLISLLAGQLRFIYEVSYYKDKGLSSREIMDRTGIKHSFRIDKAYSALQHLDRKGIMKILNRLAELEYDCKQTSDISDRLRFEMFVLGFKN